MIKAIIFDCFGVLAEDGWTPFKRKYILQNPKLAQDVADLGARTDKGMLDHEEMIEEVAKLAHVDPEILRTAVGKRVPNEELFEYIQSKLKPIYKIGLMSNANYDVLHELFTPEQASLFDASVMSFDSKMVKPDPRMYALMANRLGVQMAECLFIDDQERYCMAAEELGMRSIWYREPSQLMKEFQELTEGINQ